MIRLLSELPLLPFTGPIRIAGFTVRRIQEQVEQEFLDEDRVRAELLDLSIRYERGEISDADYRKQEAIAMRHLSEIREYKESLALQDGPAADTIQETAHDERSGEVGT